MLLVQVGEDSLELGRVHLLLLSQFRARVSEDPRLLVLTSLLTLPSPVLLYLLRRTPLCDMNGGLPAMRYFFYVMPRNTRLPRVPVCRCG